MSQPISPKIEAYLLELDRALGGIAMSERADIVTEIKSHLLDSMERQPERSVESFLEAMGEPQQVANRYLMERGLTPSKPPKRPLFKWLVIGMLGTMTLGLLTFCLLLWKFTPLIHVDDNEERVTILGGMIDINGKAGTVKVGDAIHIKGDKVTVNGSETIGKTPGTEIEIPFISGKIELGNSDSDSIQWDCHIEKQDPKPVLNKTKGKVSFDFGKGGKAHCEIKIPKQVTVNLQGSNGKIDVEDPRYHLNAKLSNGKVSISTESNQKYYFDTNVVNGKMDSFDSSDDKNAWKISVNLTNGEINHH